MTAPARLRNHAKMSELIPTKFPFDLLLSISFLRQRRTNAIATMPLAFTARPHYKTGNQLKICSTVAALVTGRLALKH